MSHPQAVPLADTTRLHLLNTSRLLEAGHVLGPVLDGLCRLTGKALPCPTVAVTLADQHLVWFVGRHGLVLRQAPRAAVPCGSLSASGGGQWLERLLDTPEFAHLVTAHGWQAYASVPVVIEGMVLGSVCAIDQTPRSWSAADRAILNDLAASVTLHVQAQINEGRARLMEARFRMASLAGQDWLWETDARGTIQWVSASLVQHTGLDPASEIGLRVEHLYEPREDDTRGSWQRLQDAIVQRAPFTDAVADRVTPRGRITVSISGTPYFDTDGRFRGYRGASRDVTQQIAAEQQARSADALLRSAIESLEVGVMISSPQGNIELANTRWRRNVAPAWQEDDPDWPNTIRRLWRLGAYPAWQHDEAACVAWRLSLADTPHAVEVNFRDRWLLVRDQRLADGRVVHFAMDISEHKRNAEMLKEKQQALLETEARLSAVLQALPDLWLVFDDQGRYVDAHANHPMLLRPFDELRGRPIDAVLSPDIADVLHAAMREARRTSQAQVVEYDATTQDKTLRRFEARMNPMPNGQMLLLARDITERQVAADKLRVSEELYRSVADAISDGLMICDVHGRIVAFNPAASRITGIAQDEARALQSIAQLPLTVLAADLQTELPFQVWPMAEVVSQGARITDHEMPVRRRDGQVLWLRLNLHALKVDTLANPFAVMFTFRDITEERRAVQELASSEERWKFALDGAGDGVWDWDIRARRLYFSSQWKHLIGCENDDIEDELTLLLDRIHPDDLPRVQEAFAEYLAHGVGVYKNEFRMRHKQGHDVWILSRGKVVSRGPDGSPTRLVGTHSDITLFKQAERAMREKHAAEAASAAKSEFLSRMSHEIRTPLNAVQGFAQLLGLQLRQSGAPEAPRTYVRQILHASQHLMGLVNDVLDLQQVEAGVLSLRSEPISLRDEVSQCAAMLMPLAAREDVMLQCDMPAAWCVVADPQRLRQVVMNVGSNAIKYNRRGGQVSFSVAELGADRLALLIRDTGAGMNTEQLARLFQPFERLGRETGAIEGTGLGLIITRSLVEAMGGQLDITSQPGCGTSVTIVLPRARDAARPAAPPPATDSLPDMPELAQPQHDVSAAAPVAPLRVMYVEDNRINAMLFEEALRPYPDVALFVAEDGPMALELAQEVRPQVLVLDAHLPGMSGFDVLRALRQVPGLESAPAYMCSADAMPEDVARAEAAGFTGYWTKPINIVEVTTTLRDLARQRDNGTP